jgi:hypothetical protein
MDESFQTPGPAAARSRAIVICSRLSFLIFCGTTVLIAGLLTGVMWRVGGQLGYTSTVATWVILPLVGIGLAIPGLRPPRVRWALAGLIGNATVWVALHVSYITATLLFGP